MGSCLSASAEIAYNQSSTAKVITINGVLIEYSSASMVSEVLVSNTHNNTSAGAFICSSDELYFDAYIPVLPHHTWLELDQIYFILPLSMLHRPLSAQDMASLALKASLALADSVLDNVPSQIRGRKRMVHQVAPIRELDDQIFNTTVTVGPTHSRKIKKGSGKRAPLRGRRNLSSLISIEE
ncbi:hypothetical protein LUZ60_003407 [Juncus effusus]|nr:hypothetical protein LUZ60_003407 [Juncus effusus]